MCIIAELTDLGAPPKIMQAAQECANCQQAGVRPPSTLVSYIQQWCARNMGQDRYGK